MTNPRTGRARGYSKQPGGSHTLRWRDDAVIRQRMEVGVRPWVEKRPEAECLAVVNAWCVSQGEPPVGRDTLYADRRHWRELIAERQAITADELVGELDHVIEVAYEKLETAKANNPGTFLSTIRQAVMDKAKLTAADGSGKDGSLRSLILEALLADEAGNG